MLSLWVILALGSAFIVGIRDIYAKKSFAKNITPTQIMFFQYLMLALLMLFFITEIDIIHFMNNSLLFILKGAFLFTSTVAFYLLLKEFDISKVSPLLNASPIFLLMLTSIFLSESVNFGQLFGILTIIAATYYLEFIVGHHDKKKDHSHHFNKKFLLLAAVMLVTISFVAILDKLILDTVPVSSNLFFTAITILSYVTVYKVYKQELSHTFTSISKSPSILVISLLANISIFLVVTAISIPTAMVSLIIPLRRTSTIIAAVGGGILFHEKDLEKKFAAVVLMILGVMLIAL